MRKTKKMAALALIITAAAGGMTSVYAAGATDETSVGASKDVKSVKDTNMLLAGTVKITTLSVTTLTTVPFDVDMAEIPNSEAGGDATKTVNVQVEQPDDMIYEITNDSASSVWVYVARATPEANGGGLPVLTNMYADAKTKDNNMLLAIKDSAENSPKTGAYDDTIEPELGEIGAPGYWMATAASSTDKYYLNSTTKRELIAKDLAVGAKAGKNEMPLTIYTSTRKDWRAGDKFNVILVFTVSVTDPTT